MFEIVVNEVNECGATGIWRILLFLRFSVIASIGYLIGYISFHYHWLKGDVDEWLDNLDL